MKTGRGALQAWWSVWRDFFFSCGKAFDDRKLFLAQRRFAVAHLCWVPIAGISRSFRRVMRSDSKIAAYIRGHELELCMSTDKNHQRALRYRELALAQNDKDKANLLNRIADEAERGVLCTVDHVSSTRRSIPIDDN